MAWRGRWRLRGWRRGGRSRWRRAWPSAAASKRLMASSVRSMPGSPAITPASSALNSTCSPFSCDHLVEDREQLLLELALQLGLQLGDLGLRVLLEALLRRPAGLLDVLLELRAGGVVQERTSLLQLGLIVLELLRLRRRLALLLRDERLNLGRRRLAFDRKLRNQLQVHDADLRALRERGGRLGRGGSLRGWRGAPAARPAPGHSPGRRSQLHTSARTTTLLITNVPFIGRSWKPVILHQIGPTPTGAPPRSDRSVAGRRSRSSRRCARRSRRPPSNWPSTTGALNRRVVGEHDLADAPVPGSQREPDGTGAVRRQQRSVPPPSSRRR